VAGSWENVVNWIAMLTIKLVVEFSAVLFSELINFALTGAISTERNIYLHKISHKVGPTVYKEALENFTLK